MQPRPAKSRPKLVTTLIETFGFSPWLASVVALFLVFLGVAALVWLWLSAPKRILTVATGPEDSSFQRYAEAYEKILARDGVTLQIIPTGGSLENLQLLQSKETSIDIGFIQGGLIPKPPEELVSLGSVAHQPMWVYYRGATPIIRLSELAGKRIGVGAKGSGTNALAMALLKENQITGPPTTLVERPAEGAAADLMEGKLDAIFLMGEAAPLQTLRTLIRAPELQLYSFNQADAYVRRIPYLNKITLPQGGFDIGQNLPAQDVTLVGATVELVAREGLNSALSDLLLEAAKEVHGRANALQKKGEFPAPLDRDFQLSDDALRYYKSGRGFTYRIVKPFWVASLINRVLVAIVPMLLLIIPAVRLLPIVYRWSIQLRIYRCYRPLLRLEQDAEASLTPEEARELMERLDKIEKDVNHLKVPASFAYQFYALRGHVAFVRSRLKTAVVA